MSNTAVITFGRMNPITVGHEKLVNKVKALAIKLDATPLVYLSHSHDNKRNPLEYATKFILAQTAFGDCVVNSSSRTPIEVLKELDGKYDNVVFVGDLSRSVQLLPVMEKYNGVEYKYDTITTVSAGDRTGKKLVDAISATKMRKYAMVNDYNNFTKGLATNLKPHSDVVSQLVRKGLNYE